jgi:hypothetical protein
VAKQTIPQAADEVSVNFSHNGSSWQTSGQRA